MIDQPSVDDDPFVRELLAQNYALTRLVEMREAVIREYLVSIEKLRRPVPVRPIVPLLAAAIGVSVVVLFFALVVALRVS